MNMNSIWFRPELSLEVANNDQLLNQTNYIVLDMLSGRLKIITLLDNLTAIVTKNIDKRIMFLTKLLKEMPKSYPTELEVKYLCILYIDHLHGNFLTIPHVLEGFSVLMDMKNFCIQSAEEFLRKLYMTAKKDKYYFYLILKKLYDREEEFIKTEDWEIISKVSQMIEGEKNPQNQILLFSFLPKFLKNITAETSLKYIFEDISSNYPIVYNPTSANSESVTREELAAALRRSLCAVDAFGEYCLDLIISKFQSRDDKIDSLKLLIESCNTFKPSTYTPVLMVLWTFMNIGINSKRDEELISLTLEALSALVAKLSTAANTDQVFEEFMKTITNDMGKSFIESTDVEQTTQSAAVLLTIGNASKESCVIVTGAMIPAIVTYVETKASPKLQRACIEFLGDLFDIAKHWDVVEEIKEDLDGILQVCLGAISETAKDFQMTGCRTLIKVVSIVKRDSVVPFVEVIFRNTQHSQDEELLSLSIETIHTIAQRYPEIIMDVVVKGKCELEDLTKNKMTLKLRLRFLSNLAGIEDLTKVIIKEMLKIVTTSNEEAPSVIEALAESMSNRSLYTDKTIEMIEGDHEFIDNIIMWIFKEIQNMSHDSLSNSFALISYTIGSLPVEKQKMVLEKHTTDILEKCKVDVKYFSFIDALYKSVRLGFSNSYREEIISLCLRIAMGNDEELIRSKACGLIAHFLNKENGLTFDSLYEELQKYVSTFSMEDSNFRPRLLKLYAWIAKALIMKGDPAFLLWLQKILTAVSNRDYCMDGSEAIRLIMNESPDYLSPRQHCRYNVLYKQRIFQTFITLPKNVVPLNADAKEAFLLCYGYVLTNTPKNVLSYEADKILQLIKDSLEYENKDLLIAMLDVLCYSVQEKHAAVASSLQILLPRLIKLSTATKAIEVRAKILRCLYEIGSSYPSAMTLQATVGPITCPESGT